MRARRNAMAARGGSQTMQLELRRTLLLRRVLKFCGWLVAWVAWHDMA